MMTKDGYLITFEGIEGVGKSTQIEAAYKLLSGELSSRELLSSRYHHKVVLTREPGGTVTGELIRELVLNNNTATFDSMTELLLIFAARAQHLTEVIQPALAENKIVLCDRFTDATYAYQGGGRQLGDEKIAVLENLVQGTLRPKLTIVLDAPVNVATQRVQKRGEKDRFESEQQDFFDQVRQYYLDIAHKQPERVHLVDATPNIATVSATIKALFEKQGLLN